MTPSRPLLNRRTSRLWFGAQAGLAVAATIAHLRPGILLLPTGTAFDSSTIAGVALVVAAVSSLLYVAAGARRCLGRAANRLAVLIASITIAVLSPLGAALCWFDAGRVTVLSPGPGGCLVAVRETQFLSSGSGDIYLRTGPWSLPHRAAAYTADDDGYVVASGRYTVSWNDEVAHLELLAAEHGSVTPETYDISCRTGHVATGERSPAPAPPPAPTSPACGPGPAMQFAWPEVELAGPRRFLAVRVSNCGPDSIELPAAPQITATDSGNAPVSITWTARPATRSLTLRPGESAYLNLSWGSNGRCELGAQTLAVDVGGNRSTRQPPCLQLGPNDENDPDYPEPYYFWSSQPNR